MRNMIEDILHQEYADFEFIIVDNGSSDGTDRILEEYAQKDRRVKIFHIAENSVGYGRNFGISVSTGEYIAFVDDDDRVPKDFLLFLYTLVERYHADIAMCGSVEVFDDYISPICIFDEKFVMSGKEALKDFLERKHIRAAMPTKLIKRDIILKHPFIERYKHEDIHVIYRYLSEASKVVLWGVNKYNFIRHGDNLSYYTSDQSRWTEAIIREYVEAYAERSRFVVRRYPDLYELALYSEWSFMISMVEKIDRFNIEECRDIQKELAEELGKNRTRFLNMNDIKQFEIEWINKYIIV